MASIIYPVAKRNILRQLKAAGVVNLTSDEIYSKAEENLKAITDFIGSKEYCFNDQISLLDLVIFSFIIMMYDGSCGKRLHNFLAGLGLNNFINNMQQIFNI